MHPLGGIGLPPRARAITSRPVSGLPLDRPVTPEVNPAAVALAQLRPDLEPHGHRGGPAPPPSQEQPVTGRLR